MPHPETSHAEPDLSSFAARKADREAREAAGETEPERRPTSFRAGANAENPPLVVTRVQA